MRAQVLVAGGGPVGLTLAMDLAWRGIDVLVLEARARGEPPSVKCNHIAARSMEAFRRLGIARAVREAPGLPAEHPNDVAFRTTTTGIEFARIHIPCRRDRYTDRRGPDGNWPTPEPPHRINQIYLEPALCDAALGMGVRLLNRTRLAGFSQDERGVRAEARDLDTGAAFAIDCAYMVGCDGPDSEVRRAIGAKLSGDAVVGRTQSSYLRAPGLLARMRAPPAWSTQSLNPRRSANMFAIDGRETWLVHNYLRPGEDFDAVDRDRCLRDILGVGDDFAFEILSKEDWTGRRLVADRFRDRRVFICGDAAHIWVPFAGYGMNAGIADAMNLSWQSAAVLAGWAPPRLLEAHEAERQPITEQVSRHAMQTAQALSRARGAVPSMIEEAGPEGDAARAEFGAQLVALNTPQYCCGGLNFGYFYDRSPIIAHDGQAPTYTMDQFTQSDVPGCRTPHVWLAEKRSLYDALGPWFTLIRLDPRADADPIAHAAARRGVPLTVLDVRTDDPAHRHRLVLSRPDQHVAWRGNAPPADPDALIAHVIGASA